MNKFNAWAEEINKDWSPEYRANATEDNLIITYSGTEVAKIDSRFKVTGTDQDAVGQLEYMVNR